MNLSTLWKILKYEWKQSESNSIGALFPNSLKEFFLGLVFMTLCVYLIWNVEEVIRWLINYFPFMEGGIIDRHPKRKEWHQLVSGIGLVIGYFFAFLNYGRCFYKRLKNRSYEI
jgi:hypothetical protein